LEKNRCRDQYAVQRPHFFVHGIHLHRRAGCAPCDTVRITAIACRQASQRVRILEISHRENYSSSVAQRTEKMRRWAFTEGKYQFSNTQSVRNRAMKIAICNLALLALAGLTGTAVADQPDVSAAAASGGFSQDHNAYFEQRELDVTRGVERAPVQWDHVPAMWMHGSSAPPATAAPEISPSSAISALVLLGGALVLLRARHDSKPESGQR
jgi:hypothetical protein